MFEHVFYKKCAYCEATVLTVDKGQGEHWRPKGEVSERSGSGDRSVVDRDGEAHRGYFWAAYDWKNILPACKECNVGSTAVPGKRGAFPIGGRRVFSSDEAATFEELNDIERPLILHPLYDDPQDHIDFDEYGQPIVMGQSGSIKAMPTISTLGLDRPALNTKREELHDEMKKRVLEAMGTQMLGGPSARDSLADEFAPRRDFALARRKYVEKWYRLALTAEFGEHPRY
jgi:hypothetical protein